MKLLEEPEIPPALEHVYEWFMDLSSSRGNTGYGPAPISYGEIADWARLTGYRPTPWEVDLIRDMDRVYMGISAEKGKKNS